MDKPRTIHKISDGIHFYISGKTGMGKTKLIKEIVMRFKSHNPHLNIYNIDTKKRGDFTEADGKLISSEGSPDAFTTTGNSMVWQPLDDNKETYSTFFKRILDAGLPSVVVIDECANMKFGDDIPRGLKLLLLQGRAAGINVIGGTQEVAASPRQLASQATWIISFNLINEYDEKTMLSRLHIVGQKHLGLKKYQFYAYNTDTGLPARLFKSYQEFLPLIH